MMTWTAPNRLALALASAPLKVRCIMGNTSPVWSVVALDASPKGAPQHGVLATFTGARAQNEANSYAAGGFKARLAKIAARTAAK